MYTFRLRFFAFCLIFSLFFSPPNLYLTLWRKRKLEHVNSTRRWVLWLSAELPCANILKAILVCIGVIWVCGVFTGLNCSFRIWSSGVLMGFSWQATETHTSPAFQNSYQEASNIQFLGNSLGKDAFTACGETEQPLSRSCAVWHTGCIMCYSHVTGHVKHVTFMRKTWDRGERNKSVFSSSGLLFPICTKSFSA